MDPARMRKALTLIVVITVLPGTALFALAHATLGSTKFAQDAAQLVGDWAGESICQMKNSPCHDEKVVYHIAKGRDPDHVTIRADKIVAGQAINMGTGDYIYDRGHSTLLNETEGRAWRFTVQGNTMAGTLTMPNKTVYRRVTLKKEE